MPNSTNSSDENSTDSIVAHDGNNMSRRHSRSDNIMSDFTMLNNTNEDGQDGSIRRQSSSSKVSVRETWNKKIEFLLAVIGFAVDLGNVWRFPYICYQSGGGAFLVPYCVMLIFGGLPLFYLELALGQYHKSGCLTVWNYICPALKGIGYAICLIDLYVGMHYNTIIAWAVYYLFSSFQADLPWLDCDHDWNTPNCTRVTDMANLTAPEEATSPAKEFFQRSLLEIHESDGLGHLGSMRWPLVGCLFSVLLLVYFSLWKGVRSTGKAVWITALAPYVVLFILLIRGITLPGASDGIYYYLTPQWEKLKSINVWVDAATQIFFSLGPGFGTLLAFSSYNKFHNNCYKDALITSIVNCLTSFLAGFVIFSVLGYMAKVQNKSIDKVGVAGPGLIFVVYPEAIAMMPGSHFWSIIFFLMLITLGLDSTFGGLEAIITGLCDEYPQIFSKNREIFVGALLLLVFVLSLPTCTQGGMYLVDFINIFGPGIAILFVVFVEAAAVCWIYGVDRFSCDVERMIGHKPSAFWRICWNFISPIFILVIFVFSLYGSENFEYPRWAIIAGLCLTLSSIVCIPIYTTYLFLNTEGTLKQKIEKMIRPIPHKDALRSIGSKNYGTSV